MKTLPIVWSEPGGGRWHLVFDLEEIAGRVECVGLEISSAVAGEGQPRRPLYAKTLRAVDFAGRLAEARRLTAGLLNGAAGVMAGSAEDPAGRYYVSNRPDAERTRQLRAGMEAAAELVAPQDGTKGGRHAKYTREDLERVATVYSAAYAQGSPAPTRAVAEALGTSRTQAAKLVARCRDPKVGLLAPTDKRKAGGILPATERGEEGD